MSDYIEVDGKKYFEEGYLAAASAKSCAEERDRYRKALEEIRDTLNRAQAALAAAPAQSEDSVPIIEYRTYIDCPHCGGTHDTEEMSQKDRQWCLFCRKPFDFKEVMPNDTEPTSGAFAGGALVEAPHAQENPWLIRSGVPYLHNLADGVDGHYCIGIEYQGTSWFWNDGRWAAFGDVFDLTAIPGIGPIQQKMLQMAPASGEAAEGKKKSVSIDREVPSTPSSELLEVPPSIKSIGEYYQEWFEERSKLLEAEHSQNVAKAVDRLLGEKK